MNVTHLECALCGREHEARQLLNLCAGCGKPLLVRYDLERAGRSLTKESLRQRAANLWRYREVLPVEEEGNIVSLGEGWTPLLRAPGLAARLGLGELFIKDESLNPTQSFKARGMTAAVSMAKELGARKLAVPSAGNAAGALAAYAARAGLEAHIFMPHDTPRANVVECRQTGAHVTLIDGLITDCGAEVARRKDREGWFDVSTLKEPYRIEGKKTMGLELAEQLGWRLPTHVVYPTGGGTGLIGMWKVFGEMREAGWLDPDGAMPRMVVAQAEGCAPIVRAFHGGATRAEPWRDPVTHASGLRVPAPLGDTLILRALRESNGDAVAVSEGAIREATQRLTRLTGVDAAPEGGCALAAAEALAASRRLPADSEVVIFNTGSGASYRS